MHSTTALSGMPTERADARAFRSSKARFVGGVLGGFLLVACFWLVDMWLATPTTHRVSKETVHHLAHIPMLYLTVSLAVSALAMAASLLFLPHISKAIRALMGNLLEALGHIHCVAFGGMLLVGASSAVMALIKQQWPRANDDAVLYWLFVVVVMFVGFSCQTTVAAIENGLVAETTREKWLAGFSVVFSLAMVWVTAGIR